MKYLTALLMLVTFNVSAYQCTDKDLKEMRSITPDQHIILAEAYLKGLKHDLGYTMMAIAWQESKAGKYLVNVHSNDFGVMGINLNTAQVRANAGGLWKRNLLAQRLIFDNDYNMDMAIEELTYWKGVHNYNWRKMVSSYNAGFKVENGKNYLTIISRNVNMFMNCYGV